MQEMQVMSSSIPGLGRFPGKRNGNSFQYSCLENSMDRRACWATVHGVEKSDMQSKHAASSLEWTEGKKRVIQTRQQSNSWTSLHSQLSLTSRSPPNRSLLREAFPESIKEPHHAVLCHHTWVDSCPHCICHSMKFYLYWFAFLFLTFLLAVNPRGKNDALFLSHCLPTTSPKPLVSAQ